MKNIGSILPAKLGPIIIPTDIEDIRIAIPRVIFVSSQFSFNIDLLIGTIPKYIQYIRKEFSLLYLVNKCNFTIHRCETCLKRLTHCTAL